MHTSTIVGLLTGLLLLSAAVGLTTQEPMMFLNGPGLIVVLGGTVAATLMSYSFTEIWRALKAFAATLHAEKRRKRTDVQEVIEIARLWSHGEIRETEAAIERIRSPFLRTGLQMVIDGAPTNQLIDVLNWRIGRIRAREHAESDVFSVMATYSPAFGMIGTLLGLVNLLRDVDEGIAHIGSSLALALVTTFYGIVLANAVLRPMSVMLRRRTAERIAALNVTKEALVMMADQHSPAQLKYTLQSFHDPDDHGADFAPVTGESRAAS